MKIIDCSTWDEVKNTLKDIRQEHQYGQRKRAEGEATYIDSWRNSLLYRGHANAEWDLLTTLDRQSEIEWFLDSYIDDAAECIPPIEAIYPRQWHAVDPKSIDNFCKKREILREAPPMLPFLIYLRHHGYPSFLLDWTLSPFVAAHFAASISTDSTRLAIFAYCEISGHKDDRKNLYEPKIHVLTRSVMTHPRHFLQQSCYTYCTRFDKNEKRQRLCKHMDALPESQTKSLCLYKITFPATERLAILRELMSNNINDFSLFQSEEGLTRSLALRNLDLEYDYEGF